MQQRNNFLTYYKALMVHWTTFRIFTWIQQTLVVKWHPSHAIRKMLSVTCYLSPLACYLSTVTCHLTNGICHLLNVNSHKPNVIYTIMDRLKSFNAFRTNQISKFLTWILQKERIELQNEIKSVRESLWVLLNLKA